MNEVLDEIPKPKRQRMFFGICSVVLLAICFFLMIKIHIGLLEVESMPVATEQDQYDKGYEQAKFIASSQNSVAVIYILGIISVIFSVISFFRKEKSTYTFHSS